MGLTMGIGTETETETRTVKEIRRSKTGSLILQREQPCMVSVCLRPGRIRAGTRGSDESAGVQRSCLRPCMCPCLRPCSCPCPSSSAYLRPCPWRSYRSARAERVLERMLVIVFVLTLELELRFVLVGVGVGGVCVVCAVGTGRLARQRQG